MSTTAATRLAAGAAAPAPAPSPTPPPMAVGDGQLPTSMEIEVGHDDRDHVYISFTAVTQGVAMSIAQAEAIAAALRTHAGLARRKGRATVGHTRIR